MRLLHLKLLQRNLLEKTTKKLAVVLHNAVEGRGFLVVSLCQLAEMILRRFAGSLGSRSAMAVVVESGKAGVDGSGPVLKNRKSVFVGVFALAVFQRFGIVIGDLTDEFRFGFSRKRREVLQLRGQGVMGRAQFPADGVEDRQILLLPLA